MIYNNILEVVGATPTVRLNRVGAESGVELYAKCEFLNPGFTVFLVGRSGNLKSTLAALFLCHYGDFDDKHLPASWESTDNALEKRLFILKDVPCVVDDYAPRADAYAQRRQEQRAQRIIRAMANRSGRSRLKADLSAQTEYIPRGLMISTGEDLPPGQSILARTLAIEVDRDRIDLEKLTEAQQHAEPTQQAMAATPTSPIQAHCSPVGGAPPPWLSVCTSINGPI